MCWTWHRSTIRPPLTCSCTGSSCTTWHHGCTEPVAARKGVPHGATGCSVESQVSCSKGTGQLYTAWYHGRTHPVMAHSAVTFLPNSGQMCARVVQLAIAHKGLGSESYDHSPAPLLTNSEHQRMAGAIWAQIEIGKRGRVGRKGLGTEPLLSLLSSPLPYTASHCNPNCKWLLLLIHFVHEFFS